MYNNYLTSRMDNNESKEPAAPIFTFHKDKDTKFL